MGSVVAKHGNKAVSSNCGSADVLEALKIKINLKPDEVEKSIQKVNFAFMFAPLYHQAMKYVAGARKKISKKTIFNLIGPLSSPAQVKKQIVGVYNEKWMMPFAEALKENNKYFIRPQLRRFITRWCLVIPDLSIIINSVVEISIHVQKML